MPESPRWYLNEAAGEAPSSIVKRGIGGYILSLAGAAITGTQALLELLLFPVRLIIEIGFQIGEALILKPLGVVEAGSTASAAGVLELELFGLPAAVLIVLVSFFMIAWYLDEEETSDFLPGVFTDAPLPFVGVDEEATEDE